MGDGIRGRVDPTSLVAHTSSLTTHARGPFPAYPARTVACGSQDNKPTLDLLNRLGTHAITYDVLKVSVLRAPHSAREHES